MFLNYLLVNLTFLKSDRSKEEKLKRLGNIKRDFKILKELSSSQEVTDELVEYTDELVQVYNDTYQKILDILNERGNQNFENEIEKLRSHILHLIKKGDYKRRIYVGYLAYQIRWGHNKRKDR